MTTSHPDKILNQIREKPAKYKKFLKYNLPKKRTNGRGVHKCTRCGRTGNGGNIQSYGLNLCRCCFRDIASHIGFKKYS
ncbi:MAG TPA: 30S ribosomal protein S14 [Candidatus Nanoarchaeia archaeon]|nr:30S ribosomal protein S14 [Candidatus Nanoarchaeia archaeon]